MESLRTACRKIARRKWKQGGCRNYFKGDLRTWRQKLGRSWAIRNSATNAFHIIKFVIRKIFGSMNPFSSIYPRHTNYRKANGSLEKKNIICCLRRPVRSRYFPLVATRWRLTKNLYWIPYQYTVQRMSLAAKVKGGEGWRWKWGTRAWDRRTITGS